MNQISMNLPEPPAEHKAPAISRTEEKPKKKKWPEAGLIYCDREETWCAYTDTNTGKCMADRCNIHDPDYVARQKEIAENMQRAHMKEIGEAESNSVDTKKEKKKLADKIMEEHAARRRWVESCFNPSSMPEHLRDLVKAELKKDTGRHRDGHRSYNW